MASRNINDLDPELAEKATIIKAKYEEQTDDELLIYCTLRTLEEQASLYRQGRPTWRIKKKQRKLEENGFGFLADLIEDVGPQYGAKVTNAVPGESWHNLGMAFDAAPLVHGQAMWSYKKNKNLWESYGQLVTDENLIWGGNWISFKDYPHAQIHVNSNPIEYYTPEELKTKVH